MRHETTTTAAGSVVAAGATLDHWANRDWREGTAIGDLLPLDRLTVRTRNSTYEIVVVTPDTADVAVRGGAFFPSFARVRLSGSSLGGSFLKLHSIHVGFRMEILFGSQSILTSPVETIAMTRTSRVM